MIRNDTEYTKAVARLKEEEKRLSELKDRLAKEGLSKEEIKRAVDPLESFHLQFREEVESYDKLKRGEFDELVNLKGIGHLLISLRIAKGLTQRDLADKLGVKEPQVSRDERNEYHGITIDRAEKILEALGAKLCSRVDVQPFVKDCA